MPACCLQIGTFLQNSFCWLPFNGDGHYKSWFKTTHDKLYWCTFQHTQSSQNGDLSLREVKIAFLIEASSEKIIPRQIRKSSIFLKKTGFKEGKVMLNCQKQRLRLSNNIDMIQPTRKIEWALRVSGAFYCFYTASFLAPRPLSVSAVFNIRSNLHRVLCGHSF